MTSKNAVMWRWHGGNLSTEQHLQCGGIREQASPTIWQLLLTGLHLGVTKVSAICQLAVLRNAKYNDSVFQLSLQTLKPGPRQKGSKHAFCGSNYVAILQHQQGGGASRSSSERTGDLTSFIVCDGLVINQYVSALLLVEIKPELRHLSILVIPTARWQGAQVQRSQELLLQRAKPQLNSIMFWPLLQSPTTTKCSFQKHGSFS